MATRRWSVAPGKSLEDITEAAGAATVTAAIELTIDCASTLVSEGSSTRKISKIEALNAIEEITQYIIRSQWPPV